MKSKILFVIPAFLFVANVALATGNPCNTILLTDPGVFSGSGNLKVLQLGENDYCGDTGIINVELPNGVKSISAKGYNGGICHTVARSTNLISILYSLAAGDGSHENCQLYVEKYDGTRSETSIRAPQPN